MADVKNLFEVKAAVAGRWSKIDPATCVRIEGRGTGISLFSVMCGSTGNRNRPHINHGSVWSPCEVAKGEICDVFYFYDVVAHLRACFQKFRITGFHFLKSVFSE